MLLPFDSVAVVVRPGAGEWALALARTLAADVTALLGRDPRLRVISDEIVAPYAASELAAEEIGRALNVQAVASCGVDADAIRLDAAIEIIDVLRETVVSHQRYLASATELASLERELVRVIGEHCPVPETLPDIAEARAGRDGAAALRIRARQLFHEGDLASAEETLRAALDLDAASPATHRQLGDLLLATGRHAEAARHHRLVAEWMPLDEGAQIAGTFQHYFGPQPLEAAPRLRELATRFGAARDWLVRALVAGGDVLSAREAAVTPFARALVAAFAAEPFETNFTAYERALLFAISGRNDDAIASLGAAQESDEAMFAAIEPLFASLRPDARFARFSRHFTPNLRTS